MEYTDRKPSDFTSQAEVWDFLQKGGTVISLAAHDAYRISPKGRVVVYRRAFGHIEPSNCAFAQPYMWIKYLGPETDLKAIDGFRYICERKEKEYQDI